MDRVSATKFLRAVLLALVVLVAFNVVVARGARSLPPQQLLQRIEHTAADARVFFLGDSQMQADADPVAFSAACDKPAEWGAGMNVALGATKSF